MATARRRLFYLSETSAQKSSRVKKRSSNKSPSAQAVPAWCQAYQRRLEAAREQLKLIQEA